MSVIDLKTICCGDYAIQDSQVTFSERSHTATSRRTKSYEKFRSIKKNQTNVLIVAGSPQRQLLYAGITVHSPTPYPPFHGVRFRGVPPGVPLQTTKTSVNAGSFYHTG